MKRFPAILFSPDPADVPGNPPAAPTPQPAPAAPPAALKVIEGSKTEREIALEKTVRDRELRVSELEDENRRLKTPPPAPPAPPAPRPEPKPKKGKLTFFDED